MNFCGTSMSPMDCIHHSLEASLFQVLKLPVEKLSALALWGDGVPYTKKKSAFVMLLGVNPTENTAKYPVVVIPEKDSALVDAHLSVLQWSFMCCQTGYSQS